MRRKQGGPSAPVFITDIEKNSNQFNLNSIVTEAGWQTIINAIRLDDDPTSVTSALQNADGFSGVWVELFIDSTLAPTDITFTPQFTTDGGNTYADYLVGVWASMVYEDTQTASGLRQMFLLPLAGVDQWRMSVVATGTDGSNYFDVTVKARAFN